MPTYQYACTACGHHLEAVQTFTDEPLTVCPECEGRLRKLFSSVGIVFKGSGFYRTDSRTNGAEAAKANGSTAESATTSDGAKPDGAKSDGAKSDGAKSADSSGGAARSTSASSAPSSTKAANSAA